MVPCVEAALSSARLDKFEGSVRGQTELVNGVLQILLDIVIEICGYLIWGLLEGILTAAGGFVGGIIIGLIISTILFCCLSSAWVAGWASCGAMFLSVCLGIMVEAASGTK